MSRGEVLGLVGESGCGKSTLGRMLVRPDRAQRAATIGIAGGAARGPMRISAARAQIIFQNPDSSLNPRKTVQAIVGRPLVLHGLASGSRGARARGRSCSSWCGSRPPTSALSRTSCPAARSSASASRARSPPRRSFIVCDEAVSALDVSVQAYVLNVLADLRDRLNVAYLFISHDLSVIAHIADRIAVMYRGAIVEEGRRTTCCGRRGIRTPKRCCPPSR